MNKETEAKATKKKSAAKKVLAEEKTAAIKTPAKKKKASKSGQKEQIVVAAAKKTTKKKAAAKKAAAEKTTAAASKKTQAASKPVAKKTTAKKAANTKTATPAKKIKAASKPSENKPVTGKQAVNMFSKPVRLSIFIAGIVFAAAALFMAGYITGEMASSVNMVSSSLEEAKQSIPSPLSPTSTSPPVTSSESISEQIAPNATPSPTPEPTLNIIKKPKGDIIGYMVFDSILDDGEPREVPIIEGTDVALLRKGVGHYENFSYPGEIGNGLLFGHRTTVFKNFDKLKIGDQIKVVTYYGTFIYNIVDMQIAEPMAPLMFEVYDKPVLTLVTCYPFVYAGHAPDRYIVICELAENTVDFIEDNDSIPFYTPPANDSTDTQITNPSETADPVPS